MVGGAVVVQAAPARRGLLRSIEAALADALRKPATLGELDEALIATKFGLPMSDSPNDSGASRRCSPATRLNFPPCARRYQLRRCSRPRSAFRGSGQTTPAGT